jgi:hypothetical protein
VPPLPAPDLALPRSFLSLCSPTSQYAIDFVTDKEFKNSCSGRVYAKPGAAGAGAQMATIEPLTKPGRYFGTEKIPPPPGFTGEQYGTLLFGCFNDADRTHGGHSFPRSPAEMVALMAEAGAVDDLAAIQPLNRYEHLYLKLEPEGMECAMASHSLDFIYGIMSSNHLQLTNNRKEGGKEKNWWDMPNAVRTHRRNKLGGDLASSHTRRRQPLDSPHPCCPRLARRPPARPPAGALPRRVAHCRGARFGGRP